MREKYYKLYHFYFQKKLTIVYQSPMFGHFPTSFFDNKLIFKLHSPGIIIYAIPQNRNHVSTLSRNLESIRS